MRHATIALALAPTVVLTLALSGCSGSADSGAPDPSPTPSSRTPAPTPPASPTPTAPVMPQAAKTHTKAGAQAFVEYFWQVVTYAQATGDTGAIRDLIVPESCDGCVRGATAIDKVYRAGGTVHGGTTTVSGFKTSVYRLEGVHQATVECDVTVAPIRFDYPGSTRDNQDPATEARDRLRLSARPSAEWRVVLLEQVQ